MKLSHAIILSAGLGTRMRPLTDSIPKPLIEVCNRPLIDWCLDWLVQAAIANVVINTSYRAQQLEDYLAPRRVPPIQFSREEPAPLETGGGIAKALPLLGDKPFLSMNSDAIFPTQSLHPIASLQQAWDESVDFLMLLVPRALAIGWHGQGDFICDDAGRIRRPHTGEDAPYIFTGVQIIHPRVFVGCPPGAFSLATLWNARRSGDGWYQRIRGVIHTGAWVNVGDLAGLNVAENYLGGASIGSRI